MKFAKAVGYLKEECFVYSSLLALGDLESCCKLDSKARLTSCAFECYDITLRIPLIGTHRRDVVLSMSVLCGSEF